MTGPIIGICLSINRTRAIVLQPARGLVYDREGVLLANNVPSFNLYVELQDVKDRDRLGEALEKILRFAPTELSEKLRARGTMTRVKLRGGLTLKRGRLN